MISTVCGTITMQAAILMAVLWTLVSASLSQSARLVSEEAQKVFPNSFHSNDDPWFCRGSPCPPFEVISTAQTYELREYAESMLSSLTHPVMSRKFL